MKSTGGFFLSNNSEASFRAVTGTLRSVLVLSLACIARNFSYVNVDAFPRRDFSTASSLFSRAPRQFPQRSGLFSRDPEHLLTLQSADNGEQLYREPTVVERKCKVIQRVESDFLGLELWDSTLDVPSRTTEAQSEEAQSEEAQSEEAQSEKAQSEEAQSEKAQSEEAQSKEAQRKLPSIVVRFLSLDWMKRATDFAIRENQYELSLDWWSGRRMCTTKRLVEELLRAAKIEALTSNLLREEAKHVESLANFLLDSTVVFKTSTEASRRSLCQRAAKKYKGFLKGCSFEGALWNSFAKHLQTCEGVKWKACSTLKEILRNILADRVFNVLVKGLEEDEKEFNRKQRRAPRELVGNSGQI